jgi:linoleoyl-CoA desaturase
MTQAVPKIAPRFNKNLPEFSAELRKRVSDYFSTNKLSTNADTKMVVKTLFYLGVWAGSFIVLLTQSLNFWQLWLTWSLWGFSFAACAVNVGHDVIHGAYTKNKTLSNALRLTFDLNGASSYMWSIMHNVAHHTYTNIIEHDEDLHPVPLLRLSPDAELLPMHKNQYWYCFLLYPVATLSWILRKDFVKVKENTVANYNNRQHPKNKLVELFAFKFVHYAVFILLPFVVIDAPFWQKMICFLSAHAVAGFYLAIIFMLAHAVEKVDFPKVDEAGMTENNWFIHQMKTTANFAVDSKLAAFISGGLNQQVEHHLFPNICSTHYPALAKIVRQTANEYDVPYLEYPSFWQALKSHARFMKNLSVA